MTEGAAPSAEDGAGAVAAPGRRPRMVPARLVILLIGGVALAGIVCMVLAVLLIILQRS